MACNVTEFQDQVLDDSDITLGYARNLAKGHGLRFNAQDAEPQEGFSSYIQVASTAVVIRQGFDPLLASSLLSLLAILSVPFVLAGTLKKTMGVRFCVGLLAATPIFAVLKTARHIAGGMETGIFVGIHQWFACWAVSFSLTSGKPTRKSQLLGVVLTLILILCRPEGLLPRSWLFGIGACIVLAALGSGFGSAIAANHFPTLIM